MILRGLRAVFSRIGYIFLALISATTAFLFAVWLPNLSLIASILPQPIPFIIKAQLLIGLTEGIRTAFGRLSVATLITNSVLMGVNVGLIAFYLRKRAVAFHGGAAATGIGGAISGVLGIGCPVCGSFILSNVLAAIGLSGGIALLPLRGEEFGVLGAALLAASAVIIAKRIAAPEICGTAEK